MTTERRKAPRRQISRIDKVGSWGNVLYHHHLECGHVEIRKRTAPAPQIACAWCLRANEKDKEIKRLIRPADISISENNIVDDEIKIEQARAAIASRFAVPLDAVDISSEDYAGQLIIRGATIYLSPEDVDRINRNR
ncbi:MAG: hypothetical protein ACKOKF_09120 [Bacteroidota bacterium]